MSDVLKPFAHPVPCSVINYVARSKEMVVNTLDTLGEAVPDPYLQHRRPKSMLCLSLASQQRIIGVLYMESGQMENAFVSSASLLQASQPR